jgi:hypothetical protein
MAQPRIRDFVSFMTTLPASMMILVCLFLPHAQNCQGRVETPWESGLWVAIVPIVVVGLLPVAWRAFSSIRHSTPELVLAFTMLAMAMFAITIPIAIALMWGYAKKTLRGELLVALCCTSLVLLWLFCFPLLMMFDSWRPAAKLTWGAGLVELFGLAVWTSAAASRARNADEERSLHVRRAPLGLEVSL